MAEPAHLTLCSFCGRSHAEVKKLIQGLGVFQGPGVYICHDCVTVCRNVLDKELAVQSKRPLEERTEQTALASSKIESPSNLHFTPLTLEEIRRYGLDDEAGKSADEVFSPKQ
jgi:ATP-dependent Clp protease ATP-binding subunit ClpX